MTMLTLRYSNLEEVLAQTSKCMAQKLLVQQRCVNSPACQVLCLHGLKHLLSSLCLNTLVHLVEARWFSQLNAQSQLPAQLA